MATRATLPRAIFIVLAVLMAATAFDGSVLRAAPKTTLQEVSEGLTCQCGCGLTIANCAHPNCGFAVPLRREIQGLIDKGMGRDEILMYMRHKYGEKILSAPTTEGFNILAWVMPFVAIAAGVGLIAFAMGRWRGAPRQAPESPGPGAEPFDAELRRRLEQEVRNRL